MSQNTDSYPFTYNMDIERELQVQLIDAIMAEHPDYKPEHVMPRSTPLLWPECEHLSLVNMNMTEAWVLMDWIEKERAENDLLISTYTDVLILKYRKDRMPFIGAEVQRHGQKYFMAMRLPANRPPKSDHDLWGEGLEVFHIKKQLEEDPKPERWMSIDKQDSNT